MVIRVPSYRFFKKYITIVPFYHITSYDSSSAIKFTNIMISLHMISIRGNENISITLIGTYFS